MVLVAIFVIRYLAIVFEHPLSLNKAASALLAGVLCWTAYVVTSDAHSVNEQLRHHLGELSQMATISRRKLLVTIALLSFLLSAVLDNLTSSIVMMSLVRRLVSDDLDRRYFGGLVIIAANSGGAWSPIGDVTTTMLWVGGQVTTTTLIARLVVPSVVSILHRITQCHRPRGRAPRRREVTRANRAVGTQAGVLRWSWRAVVRSSVQDAYSPPPVHGDTSGPRSAVDRHGAAAQREER